MRSLDTRGGDSHPHPLWWDVDEEDDALARLAWW